MALWVRRSSHWLSRAFSGNELSDKDLRDQLDELKQSVEGMRAQNSAEHDSIIARVMHMTEIVHWLKAQWERFSK